LESFKNHIVHYLNTDINWKEHYHANQKRKD
jgi:hypothetical protein